MSNDLEVLIGGSVKEIYFNEDYLRVVTDGGAFCFTVKGDCCSHSVFYDFYGVKNLLGKEIKNVEEVELTPDDIKMKDSSGWREECDKKGEHECISVYGFRFTTESEEFGNVSSVLSFRNYSNGYYGGWLESCKDREVSPKIHDDVLETESAPK